MQYKTTHLELKTKRRSIQSKTSAVENVDNKKRKIGITIEDFNGKTTTILQN